jgi:hypothetical protein
MIHSTRNKICEMCGKDIYVFTEPSYTDVSVTHKKAYHQGCLFKWVADKFQTEKDELD